MPNDGLDMQAEREAEVEQTERPRNHPPKRKKRARTRGEPCTGDVCCGCRQTLDRYVGTLSGDSDIAGV